MSSGSLNTAVYLSEVTEIAGPSSSNFSGFYFICSKFYWFCLYCLLIFSFSCWISCCLFSWRFFLICSLLMSLKFSKLIFYLWSKSLR